MVRTSLPGFSTILTHTDYYFVLSLAWLTGNGTNVFLKTWQWPYSQLFHQLLKRQNFLVHC